MKNLNQEINALRDKIMTGPLSNLVYYSNGETDKPDGDDVNNVIRVVLESDVVKNLLYHFWQRSSDACPLSVSLAEKEEDEFSDFVLTISNKL